MVPIGVSSLNKYYPGSFDAPISARHTASARCRTLWHESAPLNAWDYLAEFFTDSQHLSESLSLCFGSQDIATRCNPLQPVATRCNPLQPVATRCNPSPETCQVAVRRPCNTWATATSLGFQRRTIFEMNLIICRESEDNRISFKLGQVWLISGVRSAKDKRTLRGPMSSLFGGRNNIFNTNQNIIHILCSPESARGVF